MAKPQKFRIVIPPIRIVNRCILCGIQISPGKSICDKCKRRKMIVEKQNKLSEFRKFRTFRNEIGCEMNFEIEISDEEINKRLEFVGGIDKWKEVIKLDKKHL